MSSKVVVLTAPSGAGKSTIAKRVLAAFPQLSFSVSATTRPRRSGEEDGLHYQFVSREEFEEGIASGRFLEHEEVYPGLLYGTEREAVEKQLERGHVLLDIDVRGAANVKRLYGDRSLVIFIRPPSIDILRLRLRLRGTETETSLRERLERAREEMQIEADFDVVVVNDDLEIAVEETIKTVGAFLEATG